VSAISFLDQSSLAVNLLAVANQSNSLDLLARILGDEPGYSIVRASSASEACNLFSQVEFTLVLVDICSHELHQFQIADLIREAAQVPILFITPEFQYGRDLFPESDPSSVDFIFKPLDPLILKSKVSMFVELQRQKKRKTGLPARTPLPRSNLNATALQTLNFTVDDHFADAIPHLIWRTDAQGRVRFFNQAWLRFTGLDKSASLGTGWQTAFHIQDIRLLSSAWKQAMQWEEGFEIQCRIRDSSNQFRWHCLKVIPERSRQGDVISWVATATDIQESRDFEGRLQTAQRAVEAAQQAKTFFLANMSHEIRTPLGAIVGFTDLSLDPALPHELRMENLAAVQRNSQKLLKIIDEILDISKVDVGRLDVDREATDLPELFESVVRVMRGHSQAKNLKFRFQLQGQVPQKVWTDPARLKQILVNLIDNAIKFTHDGSIEVQVSHRTNAGAYSFLQVAVKDTGIGVQADVVDHLFTPFLQADPSSSRLYGGTGLGLALSRQLAKALGGDVWLASSQVGKGSHFVFEISGKPVDDSVWPCQIVDESNRVEEGGNMSVSQELQGAKVLLVEDAEDNQVLISHFLRKAGAQVETANNGVEAVEKALAGDYTAVLMDIQMPFMDGYEATAHLRKSGYLRPIIALTAHALKEERDKALHVGCNFHLTKPINRAELIASVQKILTLQLDAVT
jgi:PAS domain S-box-containing protein